MTQERELLKSIQAAKAAMVRDLKALQQIQKDAGRADAGNAVFLARSMLDVWHGNATRDLFQFFPEHVLEIVIMGPGR